MNPIPELNIDGFFDNIISSYETRIQKIHTAFQSSENILESSHSLFDNVQKSLSNLNEEREILNSKLCENLAKNGSLRKKDYNIMMSVIIEALDNKERSAEKQFLNFIETQKKTAQSLKNTMLSIKDSTSQNNSEKISVIKDQLPQILKSLEEKKDKVMKTFLDFQLIHNKIIDYLEDLLKKGNQIQINDIKSVKNIIIKEIN